MKAGVREARKAAAGGERRNDGSVVQDADRQDGRADRSRQRTVCLARRQCGARSVLITRGEETSTGWADEESECLTDRLRWNEGGVGEMQMTGEAATSRCDPEANGGKKTRCDAALEAGLIEVVVGDCSGRGGSIRLRSNSWTCGDDREGGGEESSRIERRRGSAVVGAEPLRRGRK